MQERHGRYVQSQHEHDDLPAQTPEIDSEGRYVEGDYGTAGSEDARTTGETGRFVEGDYGTAGDVPGRAAGDPRGRYVESDERDRD